MLLSIQKNQMDLDMFTYLLYMCILPMLGIALKPRQSYICKVTTGIYAVLNGPAHEKYHGYIHELPKVILSVCTIKSTTL